MNKSFTSFVTKTYNTDIFNTVADHIHANENSLDFSTYKCPAPSYYDVEDITIKNVYILGQKKSWIQFGINCYADIFVSEIHSHNDNFDHKPLWFTVYASVDLQEENSFKITNLTDYGKEYYDSNSDDYLVPLFKDSDYETIAEEFLAEYDPESIKNIQAININTIINRLNLNIEKLPLSSDHSIFGQCCFQSYTNPTAKKQIQPGTILIDPDAFYLYSLGSENFTIIHECIHWKYHYNAFLLASKFNEDKVLSCYVTSKFKNTNNPLYWMEYQANHLTPMILMPKKNFIQKTISLMNLYSHSDHIQYEAQMMPDVIKELASFFKVSRTAATIRLIELGFSSARSSFEYVDGHYVTPYQASKPIGKDTTYTISTSDFFYLGISDPLLSELLSTGNFIFADNHICINNDKYISLTNNIPKLTIYGLSHINECCIRFNMSTENKTEFYEDLSYICFLNRDKNSTVKIKLTFDSKNKLNESLAEQIKRRNHEISTVYNSLPNSLSETLIVLMNWADMTLDALSAEADVGRATINRIRNNKDNKTDKLTIIKLCIGMHLPYILSEDLLRKAGYTLTGSEEDLAFRLLLQTCADLTISECRDLLSRIGIKL